MKHNKVGKHIRKVIPAGGSLAITLPADYVKAHDIKAGDKIELTYNDVFLGKPIKLEVLSEKLTEIERALEEVKTKP
jgi:antitoxin component of MazEF toxin-antitoxin module